MKDETTALYVSTCILRHTRTYVIAAPAAAAAAGGHDLLADADPGEEDDGGHGPREGPEQERLLLGFDFCDWGYVWMRGGKGREGLARAFWGVCGGGSCLNADTREKQTWMRLTLLRQALSVAILPTCTAVRLLTGAPPRRLERRAKMVLRSCSKTVYWMAGLRQSTGCA